METKSKEFPPQPKIKRLLWRKTEGGEGIEAIIPFGSYEIYKRRDGVGFILWWFGGKPYVFEKEFEAMEFAQKDFENRIKQCIEEVEL